MIIIIIIIIIIYMLRWIYRKPSVQRPKGWVARSSGPSRHLFRKSNSSNLQATPWSSPPPRAVNFGGTGSGHQLGGVWSFAVGRGIAVFAQLNIGLWRSPGLCLPYLCINELRASSLLATGLANRECLHYNQENSPQDEVSYKEWNR